MEFSRQEYWSRLPFPTPGDRSWPRDWTPISWIPHTGSRFFTTEPPRKTFLCGPKVIMIFYSIKLLSAFCWLIDATNYCVSGPKMLGGGDFKIVMTESSWRKSQPSTGEEEGNPWLKYLISHTHTHTHTHNHRTFLVAQWWRIHLPMQEMQVPRPGPGRHHMLQSNWDHAPQPVSLCSRAGSHNYWAHVMQLLKPLCPRARAQQQKSQQWEARALKLERSPGSPQLENAWTAVKTQHSPK